MKTKTSFIQVAALLAILAFTGWSCGQGYGVSNWEPDTTNSDTRNQTQTYRNDEWGIAFQYPADWQYREYRETIEGEEEMTLAFSDVPLPDTLPPEPLFPIMISRDTRTVDEIVAIHTDAISIEDFSLGGRSLKVITRYSDILEANYPIYLVPLQVGSLQFLPLDIRYISTVENMITTLSDLSEAE